MNDSPQRDSSSVDSDALRGDGVSRRKLVRAGLASAPILMGLKSESALATGSVVCKPSMWASIKAANCRLSRQVIATNGNCKDYKHWGGSGYKSNSVCKQKFHAEALFTKDYFTKDFDATGKAKKSSKGVELTDKGLWDVCQTDWKSSNTTVIDELSRNCAAIFLNIKLNTSVVCPVNEATCKEMWTSCKGGGTWLVPGTKVYWTAADCNEYLSYVCGKSLPTSC